MMKSIQDATIRIKVDPTNPGQFFACCGLLELADRLWPGAEGWFEEDLQVFNICGTGSLHELVSTLAVARIESSLTDAGLRRLGTLLSANKLSLTTQDQIDKESLRNQWQTEHVFLFEPFSLKLCWWWDNDSQSKNLKTWAAKQFVMAIVRPMFQAMQEMVRDGFDPYRLLQIETKLGGLPFYFDAANNTQNTPRDNGFAPADIKRAIVDRPALELLAFFGLQRFRPNRELDIESNRYTAWRTPSTVEVASAIASGSVDMLGNQTFGFRVLFRTEYMKAFLPATTFFPRTESHEQN